MDVKLVSEGGEYISRNRVEVPEREQNISKVFCTFAIFWSTFLKSHYWMAGCEDLHVLFHDRMAVGYPI